MGTLGFIGVDAFIHGGLSGTAAYQPIAEEEPEQSDAGKMMPLQIKTTEVTEPETNHKKQVIVTVPETEMNMEPGPIPD